jgi:hypothetical protein
MHRLRRLRLGLRAPHREAMGRPARMPLRRSRCALPGLQRHQRRQRTADAGRLQNRCRQRRLAALSWSTPFPDPIGGRKLVTLKDVATFITKLPKAGRAGMVRRDRGADVGCRARRSDDDGADRHDAGVEPERRARVQSQPQRSSLGSKSQPSADTAARKVCHALISSTSDAHTLSSACLAACQ